MEADNVPVAFLRVLMEQIADANLELWGEYIGKDFDVSSSYDVLRESLSKKLTEKDVEGVRAFLKICSKKEISAIDIFSNVEDLSDEIKA